MINSNIKNIEREIKNNQASIEEMIEQGQSVGMLELEKRNRELNSQIGETKIKKLSELISDDDFNIPGYEEIRKYDYYPLIRFLIRDGYIDESYQDYISHFSEPSNPGSNEFLLAREGKKYLRSISERDPLGFTFSLKNINSIVQGLNDVDFGIEAILNFDLLNYLLENNSKFLANFIYHLEKEKRYDFIWEFIQHNRRNQKNIDLFVQSLNEKWSSIIFDYEDEGASAFKMKDYLLYSFLVSPKEILIEMDKNSGVADFVTYSPFFLKLDDSELEIPDNEKLLHVFGALGIKFRQIDSSLADSDIFELIYKHDMYLINKDMTFLILEHKYGIPNTLINTESLYTSISAKPEQPLYNYVSDNMVALMDLILSNSEVFLDDERAAIEILKNTQIPNEKKELYAEKLETKISDLIQIPFDLWTLLIEKKKVAFSLMNIIHYFGKEGYSQDLINFINENKDELIVDLKSIEEEQALEYFMETINCEELDNEKYQQIISNFNRNISNLSIILTNQISEEKIKILITSKKVEMNNANLSYIRSNYAGLKAFFILTDVNSYSEIFSSTSSSQNELLDVLKSAENKTDIEKLVSLHASPISLLRPNLFELAYTEPVISYIIKNKFSQSDLPNLHQLYNAFPDSLKHDVVNVYIQNFNYIIQHRLKLSFEFLSKILSFKDLVPEQKKNLFIMELGLNHLDKEQVQSLLELLKMTEYNKVFSENISIPATEDNRKILENFKSRRWIQYNQHDGMFDVSPLQ